MTPLMNDASDESNMERGEEGVLFVVVSAESKATETTAAIEESTNH
jgi:hypothetical protein